MPSLMLPRIASGPITKRREAETNPSTKGESVEALNLTRSFSPTPSNRSSSFNAEPIRPPMSNEPRTTRIGHPCGSALMYLSDHKGIKAEAAPSNVTRPRTSVNKVLVRAFIRFPTKTPREAPKTIVRILITVPTPGNI